jgi:hypothetical protein
MELGERLLTNPETAFHADCNKLLFVSIALMLTVISAYFDLIIADMIAKSFPPVGKSSFG